MKKKEIIFIILLFIAIGLFYSITAIQKNTAKTVSISVDGTLWKEVPLSKNNTLTVKTPQGYNIVTIQNQTVSVTEADCPDQLCLQQKSIQTTNEMIVCLPHKVVIEIK